MTVSSVLFVCNGLVQSLAAAEAPEAGDETTGVLHAIAIHAVEAGKRPSQSALV